MEHTECNLVSAFWWLSVDLASSIERIKQCRFHRRMGGKAIPRNAVVLKRAQDDGRNPENRCQQFSTPLKKYLEIQCLICILNSILLWIREVATSVCYKLKHFNYYKTAFRRKNLSFSLDIWGGGGLRRVCDPLDRA